MSSSRQNQSHYGSGGKQQETLDQELAGPSAQLAVEREADPQLRQAAGAGDAEGEAAADYQAGKDTKFKPTSRDMPLAGDTADPPADAPVGGGGGGEAEVTGDTDVLDT